MTATAEISPEIFRERATAIEQEIARVMVGQQRILRNVLICMLASRHALLEGVPGLGKTLLIRTLASTLQLQFSRIQFTPDLMPSDIIGTDILEETEEGRRAFRFQHGPIFANLILADEINRATPKTQSALLEAMQEKTVTVAGRRYALEAPFFVLATQNPLEMEGTYPLPEAQLDRFLFKIQVDYPAVDELVRILDRTTGIAEPTAQAVASGEEILEMGALALNLPVASHLSDYVARLVIASHPNSTSAPPEVHQYIRYGASPRGAQAILIGAKVNALLEGRYNVSFEDIETVAAPALRHRLLLNFEGLAENIIPDTIVHALLRDTPKGI